jgi:ParB-like chromosome segregation protein Spo0J
VSRPVHPAAELFPLLEPDKVAELAADIAGQGLLFPVVVMPDGAVLDGRNRLAACEMAGVEPTFTTYDGDDPVGYVVSVNLRRRHLSPSQRVDVTFKLRDEGWSLRRIAGAVGVTHPTVLNDLAAGKSLPPDSMPSHVEGADGKTYPAKRSPAEPTADDIELDRRRRGTAQFAKAVASLWALLGDDDYDFAATTWLPEANPHQWSNIDHLWTAGGLRQVAKRLESLADSLEPRGGSLCRPSAL